MLTRPLRYFLLLTVMLLIFLHNGKALAQDDGYCFSEAERYYGVSAQILWAISKVESGHNPAAVNKNTNGSIDYCHMQVNSSWKKVIGTESWQNLADPCYCTMVGAWIFAGCVQKYGYTWEAVGCYHSQTPSRRDSYALKIYNQIEKLRITEKKKDIGTSDCGKNEAVCPVSAKEETSS